MGLSRHEVNLRRLLVKCELMIKNNQKDDERFSKYISSLTEMMTHVEQIDPDNISNYSKRINVLKKIVSILTTDTQLTTNGAPVKNISNRAALFGDEDNLRLRTSKNTEDLDELLEYHENWQEKISNDMLALTRNLKEQSELANKIIKQDTEIAGKSANLTESNFSKLKVESEKLAEHSSRACKCWMWVMLIIVMVLFINMVLFMKVMKKRI